VIQRDVGAPRFRIFHVSFGGQFVLAGAIVQRGFSGIVRAGTILNLGATLLEDTIITDSDGEDGAIVNSGEMTILRTVVDENGREHGAGGITNGIGAILTIDSSTVARNASIGAGGLVNRGTLVVQNSSIIFNSTDGVQAGGGIANIDGPLEIVSTMIAKNKAGNGGGLNNSGGTVSITNSTIRE
jgi:hypothetical protein